MGFKKLTRSVTIIILIITTVAISANIIISPSAMAYAFSQSADLNSDQSMNRPSQQGTSEKGGSGSVPFLQATPTTGASPSDGHHRRKTQQIRIDLQSKSPIRLLFKLGFA